MVIINVWLTRGRKGTGDWESRSATQVMFKWLVWDKLSHFDVKSHPKIRPLAARGWRVEGWALVAPEEDEVDWGLYREGGYDY